MHSITKCRLCAVTITQCRCPAKDKTVKLSVCAACKGKAEATGTFVPKWVLEQMMAEWQKRPKDQCTFCGAHGVLRNDTITFTRNNHSEIDGTYECRVCPKCSDILTSHPSFMLRQ